MISGKQILEKKTSPRMKLDLIERWAAEIINSDFIVLVEGAADEKALRILGVKRVYHLDKQPLYLVVEELSASYKEIILLLDLDIEGDKLFSRLKSDFIASGIKVEINFRKWLRLNTSIRQVEDLKGYALNLRKLVFGEDNLSDMVDN